MIHFCHTTLGISGSWLGVSWDDWPITWCPTPMKSWHGWIIKSHINTLRQRQNGRHFADDVLKCISLNDNAWISLMISLKFVPNFPINSIPALVQIMVWRRWGDKPLSEPIMVSILTLICVTRPQWVLNNQYNYWSFPKSRLISLNKSVLEGLWISSHLRFCSETLYISGFMCFNLPLTPYGNTTVTYYTLANKEETFASI